LGHYLSSFTKDLNGRLKTSKLVEENIEETLQDQGIENDFLNMTPTSQEIKSKY
jgi:hypothetical protein